jgi:hypothetical protein
MIKVTKKDIGRKVIYSDGFKREKGIILSFNKSFVFVRYGRYASEATLRKDLEWDNEKETKDEI